MRKFIICKDETIGLQKRASAWLIDFILIIILGIFFLNITIPLSEKTNAYKNANSIIDEKINIMSDLACEAKLIIKDEEDNILDDEMMYKQYAIGHILLSYDLNKEYFNENGIVDLENNELIKDKYEKITPLNDPLAYFYYEYLVNNVSDINYEGLSKEDYFKKVLLDNNLDLSIFDMTYSYPSLKKEIAISLYTYIILEEKIDNTEGNKNNTILVDIFTNTYKANRTLFESLDIYQAEYLIYQENYQILVNKMNINYIISYSLSFIIIYILIPLLMKEKITIGYRFNKLFVDNNLKSKIIRKVFDYVINYSSIFIIAMFVSGTNALILPLFNIGTLCLGHIFFIISILMKDCIKNHKDIADGGKYNNIGFHGTGISNASDALAAVKENVFEKKVITLQELIKALDNNFEGYEKILHLLISSPKMGNNDDYVDSIGTKLLHKFAIECSKYKNSRDGIYRAGTGTAMYYIWYSENMKATADGRKKGEPFSANYSPSLNHNFKGVLSVVQSFTKPNLSEVCNGGPLTLEFHDTLFRNEEGTKKVAMLVKTFINLGGHQMQLNAINRDVLLDAQIHPEDHKNLIVRVWGWSGYFNELDLVYQNHIIKRLEFLN